MLRLLLMLASIANTAGGLVLIGTWATMWQRVPIIVLFIGGSLLIQGVYTILYLRGDLDRWGDLATGALFAGEGLSVRVGAGGLIQGISHNLNTDDLPDGAGPGGISDACAGAVGAALLFSHRSPSPS